MVLFINTRSADAPTSLESFLALRALCDMLCLLLLRFPPSLSAFRLSSAVYSLFRVVNRRHNEDKWSFIQFLLSLSLKLLSSYYSYYHSGRSQPSSRPSDTRTDSSPWLRCFVSSGGDHDRQPQRPSPLPSSSCPLLTSPSLSLDPPPALRARRCTRSPRLFPSPTPVGVTARR